MAEKKKMDKVRIRIRSETAIVHKPGEVLTVSGEVYENIKRTVERIPDKKEKKEIESGGRNGQ